MGRSVKSINSFDVYPPIRNSLFVAGALFVIGIVLAFLIWPGNVSRLTPSDFWGVVLMGLPLAFVGFAYAPIVLWEGKSRNAPSAAYKGYLAGLDVATLMAAQKSPELDKLSRREVTRFLNKNHPGWSFNSAGDDSGHAASSSAA